MSAVVETSEKPAEPAETASGTKPEGAAEPTTAAAAADTAAPAAAGDGDGAVGDEETSTAVFKPLVQLEATEAESGEEDEQTLFSIRGKLFRYTETMLNKGSGKKEWIQRGVGDIKLLKNSKSQEQRLLMRQEKTMKLIVNCGVDPRIRLTKSTTSDMAWVWVGYDFSDGVELVQETFCLKATTPEDATKFKEAFEMAQEEMKKLMEGADGKPDAAADAAADALSGLSTAEPDAPKSE